MNSFTPKHIKLVLLYMLLIIFPNLIFAQTQVSNLPAVYVNTFNNQQIKNRVDWVQGTIAVQSADTSEQLSMLTDIRGRGNSTWELPKKPYRIKLGAKYHLLNLPAKDKNWVLLANYGDKTLMRNAVAFKIGQILGFEFTPTFRFVDFFLNDVFQGNYLVTDQIEVGKNRIDIDKIDSLDTTEPNITGGYHLEIDGFASGEAVWFTSSMGLKISLKSPDEEIVNSAQLNYIKNYIDNFETTLFSFDFKDPVKGYRAKVDTTSLINWYISCELTGNADCFWSTNIYKKRLDDKLYFGPMWDYDLAFNNDVRQGDMSAKLMRQSAYNPRTWIERFWTDEWFQKAVDRRWKGLVAANLQSSLLNFIDETALYLNRSQQLNFSKWNNLSSRVFRETYLFSNYQGGVDYLKSYVTKRISFLNQNLAFYEAPKPTGKFVPDNYYYTIMNKRTNNVIQAVKQDELLNAHLVMWQPIENDYSQLWEFDQINDSLFRIKNKNSGYFMAGNGKGVNLIQVEISNDDSQKWKIVPVGVGGIYGLVNQKSGYSINNSGGGFANGTSAIEWSNNITGSENQQWYLQRAAVISSVNVPNSDISQFEIYPNPTDNFARLRLIASETNRIKIIVQNVSGQVLYQLETKEISQGSNLITIPTSCLQPGLYFVQIVTDNNVRTTLKLIVKH